MEIVANEQILGQARMEAAKNAEKQLVRVVLTLREDEEDSPRVKEVIRTLRRGDLWLASEAWDLVRDEIMEGRLS